MLRFLVAVDHTIESSFALRAACRLAKERGGYLEALHVLPPSTQAMDYGAGWAIHTYKRERIADAYRDMGGVIASEREAYDTRPDLKVVSGGVAKEIVREASSGSFDVLFVGSVHPLEGPHRGILLKLLLKISCPLVIIRHYRPLKNVLLLIEDEKNMGKVVSQAARLFKELPVTVHVICCGEPTEGGKGSQDLLRKTRQRLADEGLDAETPELQGGMIQKVLDQAPDYDLVTCGIRRRRRPGPLVMKMLQAMPAPLMLCP